MTRRFDFDQLAQSDVFRAADNAYDLVFRLQKLSAAEQVCAIGFLLKELFSRNSAPRP